MPGAHLRSERALRQVVLHFRQLSGAHAQHVAQLLEPRHLLLAGLRVCACCACVSVCVCVFAVGVCSLLNTFVCAGVCVCVCVLCVFVPNHSDRPDCPDQRGVTCRLVFLRMTTPTGSSTASPLIEYIR